MLSRYNPPMPETLAYAAPLPWYRRRRWLYFLTLLILVVGYVLAVPQYRIWHQHQIRRTEIRKQFTIEVAAARQALDNGQLETAALAILHARFPGTRSAPHATARPASAWPIGLAMKALIIADSANRPNERRKCRQLQLADLQDVLSLNTRFCA